MSMPALQYESNADARNTVRYFFDEVQEMLCCERNGAKHLAIERLWRGFLNKYPVRYV